MCRASVTCTTQPSQCYLYNGAQPVLPVQRSPASVTCTTQPSQCYLYNAAQPVLPVQRSPASVTCTTQPVPSLSVSTVRLKAVPSVDWSGSAVRLKAVPSVDWSGSAVRLKAVPSVDWSGSAVRLKAVPFVDWSGSAVRLKAVPSVDWSGSAVRLKAVTSAELFLSLSAVGGAEVPSWVPRLGVVWGVEVSISGACLRASRGRSVPLPVITAGPAAGSTIEPPRTEDKSCRLWERSMAVDAVPRRDLLTQLSNSLLILASLTEGGS